MFVMILIVGCASHTHVVGNGAQGTEIVEARQWYILYGLVPINDVDSHAMAEGGSDYTIVTEATPLDVMINIFTSMISVNSRTVTVTK